MITLGWFLKNKATVFRWLRELFQISRLQLYLTVNGVTQRSVIVFNGRNAELNLAFNVSGACAYTMPNVGVDGSATPYADEATAEAAILAQAFECTVQATNGLANLATTLSAGAFNLTDSSLTTYSFVHGFAARLTAGALTVNYALTLDAGASSMITVDLYDETWTAIESQNAGAPFGTVDLPPGTLTFTDIPADGCYFIVITALQTPGAPTTSMAVDVTVNNAGINVGSGITAAWDDGVDTGTVTCVP